MNTPADQGISTDELTGISGLSHRALSKAMEDLETLGIARNDVAIIVAVHIGVENQSRQRMVRAVRLEKALIARMRELAALRGGRSLCHLRFRSPPQQERRGGRTADE